MKTYKVISYNSAFQNRDPQLKVLNEICKECLGENYSWIYEGDLNSFEEKYKFPFLKSDNIIFVTRYNNFSQR